MGQFAATGSSPNAYIVSPFVVAVVIFITNHETGVRKRPIDPQMTRGLSALRPGIGPIPKLSLNVRALNPAMASTS